MPKTYRKWIFAKPIVDNVLGLEQFEERELPIPELNDGQALVRVRLINLHSATRWRMTTGMTQLGETDRSNYACADVVQSRDKAFRDGDTIACQAGWQDYQIVSSADSAIGYAAPSEPVKALNHTNSQWTYVFRPDLVKMWPPDVLMDVFGTSGMTAYFGLRECGPLTPKDVVAVAGTTGSVGALAAQLAKCAGSRVLGFARGADRCQWVIETLGIDRCLDTTVDDFARQLAAAAPNGIDVFSDGIGGTLTETVAALMNQNGRLFSYGGAGAYYAEAIERPSRRSLRETFGISGAVEKILAERNIKSEAWIVDRFYHERLKAEDDLSRLLHGGALKPINDVVDGFENLPAAVVDLYRSPHAGKRQVRFESPR